MNSLHTGSCVVSDVAEVAAQHLPDIVDVLHRQRPVEAELVQQPLAPRRVHAALARQVLDRIAGDQVDQRERRAA